MTPPFLVEYGALLWKCVVGAVGVFAAIGCRWWLARRGRRLTWTTAITCAVVALGAAAQAALFAGMTGEIAMEVAGDRPFDGRDNDEVPRFHPLVIAAATPGYRDDALAKLRYAGFELEDTCEQSWNRGEYERLARRSDCAHDAYWHAQADLALGLPCAAADELDVSGFVGEWTRERHPLVDFMAALGCHRWAQAAEAAARLDDGGYRASQWACVAASLTARVTHTQARYPAGNSTCLPFRMLESPIERLKEVAASWAALGEADRMGLRDSYVLSYLLRFLSEGVNFAKEVLFPEPDWETAVDLFGDPMFGPEFLTVAAPLFSQSPASFTERDRATLSGHVALSAVIEGDFAKAHEAITAMRARAAPFIAAAAEGSRDSLLARDVELLGAIVTFREGGVPPAGIDAWTYAALAFPARRGDAPSGETHHEVEREDRERILAILAGDRHALGLTLYRRGQSHQLLDLDMSSLLSGALPRLRPTPPELVRWLNEPHLSETRRSPAELAWDSAARRDALRALGALDEANRWAQIARRQWALATDPELLFYYEYLRDEVRF